MSHDDPWRDSVSQALGRIEANITNLTSQRVDHDERIRGLETKQWKRDGIIGSVVILLPFFVDPIKRALNIG